MRSTRSRVNFFMKKFEKLGFIGYEGGLQVNDSLLSVVLHDGVPEDGNRIRAVFRAPRMNRVRACP
jgi:hypothetical protein